MAAWRLHEKFVVMRWLRGIPQFWTGNRWSCEYPDAVLFSHLPTAERLACDYGGNLSQQYVKPLLPVRMCA